MKKHVYKSVIRGTIDAPSSKSMAQRAIACAVLSDRATTLYNLPLCNDVKAALGIASAFGCEVSVTGTLAHIKNSGTKKVNSKISCGESGLCLRMFSPLTALLEKDIELCAEGSLLRRSVKQIEKPLKDLGVKISTNMGFPPVKICGPVTKNNIELNGSEGSQLLTGLLIALPSLKHDSYILVNNLKSRPYIDMTLEILRHFSVNIESRDYRKFIISGNQRHSSESYTVEGDWSNAALLMTGAALTGELTVRGIRQDTKQGDRKILEALRNAGADLKILRNSVRVRKGELKAFNFDATDSPDLFPPLVALAVNCRGTTEIRGVKRLHNKESSRGIALQESFNSLGADINISGDVMKIKGNELYGGEVSSYNDHRMAMALSIAGLASKKPVIIHNTEAVDKSYPDFFKDLKSIGGNTDE